MEPRQHQRVVKHLMLLMVLALTACSAKRPAPTTLFCAASLAPAVEALVQAYRRSGGTDIRITSAASSTLARQILHGAPADIFLAAHPEWTERLYRSGLMVPAAKAPQIQNDLVWVSRASTKWSPLGHAPPPVRRLAIADPSHVPAGSYARSALEAMGWWSTLSPKVLPGADVRSALRYVLQGEADAAVVYRSETLALPPGFTSRTLPQQPDITYAMSVRPKARAGVHGFLEFLGTPTATTILVAHGFGESEPSSVVPARSTSVWPILTLSLQVALLGVLVTLLPGIVIGWVLARRQFRGKVLVEALVDLPLVLPPVVVGWALLTTFGREGPLGSLGLSFSTLGAGVAAAVMGFPLLVRSVRLAVEYVDPKLEDAASILGAAPIRVWWSITLPLALPGVVTGALLAFARSLGEFGATITFAGSIPGHTRTLPLAIYEGLQAPGGEGLVLRLVGVSVAVSLGALLLSEWLKRRAIDDESERHRTC